MFWVVKGDLREVANGSGDELYDYVLILCIFVAALVVTGIWSWLDRKRKNYQQLYQWLRLFMRCLLGSAMMIYGASKLLPMQFADVGLARLLDPVGHLSPMSLLWTFMGYSRAYSFFGGVAEMLGGLLLAVPRFTTLGALVSVGVMSNVLMLNLCYDVDRKLYTIHLVLIGFFLVLPDLKRLANFFILNRMVEPATTVPLLKDRQLNRGVLVLQYLWFAAALVAAFQAAHFGAISNAARVASPLRGIWSVEQFVSDNVLVPPLVTDSERWRHVVFDTPGLMTIQPMDGKLREYSFRLDDGGKNLRFSKPGDPSGNGNFHLEMPDNNEIVMTGRVQGRKVSATLHRVDISDPSRFSLIHRGFHWINQDTPWR